MSEKDKDRLNKEISINLNIGDLITIKTALEMFVDGQAESLESGDYIKSIDIIEAFLGEEEAHSSMGIPKSEDERAHWALISFQQGIDKTKKTLTKISKILEEND